ncbi:MAG TPA: Uma2 family endonuclease [Chloroflexia bacterium]|nr:Uma2 family endonuclease [Chloroflexia bacterium]
MALPVRKADFERTYTVAEFIDLPEYNERYELIDGRLVEKPVAKFEHGLIADIINKKLWIFDPEEKLVKMLQEVSIYITSDYAPAPDLSFWVASRVPARNVPIAPRPDLAIEIQSPDQSLKSLTDKAKRYIQAGVSVVWIIQPNKEIAAVFKQGLEKPLTVQPDGVLDAEEVIPGFKVGLKTLFE